MVDQAREYTLVLKEEEVRDILRAVTREDDPYLPWRTFLGGILEPRCSSCDAPLSYCDGIPQRVGDPGEPAGWHCFGCGIDVELDQSHPYRLGAINPLDAHVLFEESRCCTTRARSSSGVGAVCMAAPAARCHRCAELRCAEHGRAAQRFVGLDNIRQVFWECVGGCVRKKGGERDRA